MADIAMNPLTLVQLTPDREVFAHWAATNGWLGRGAARQGHPDLGYAWHVLLKSAFADLAPKPFVDRSPLRSNQLLGYVPAEPERIRAAIPVDGLIARALGMDEVRMNQMPDGWHSGQRLSFEVRARPVIRTRTNPRSGSVDEIDIAQWRARKSPEIDREQAYADWLRSGLARANAATLERVRMNLFRRTRVVRRSQRGARSIVTVEGPEAWLCGGLVVNDPQGFAALLRRGIGRHRSFGFGCLLIAPPGVLE